jgi:hypothetical protein
MVFNAEHIRQAVGRSFNLAESVGSASKKATKEPKDNSAFARESFTTTPPSW